MKEQRLGWDDITEALEKIYPDQKDPKHYGTMIKWKLGGNDPLDGISIYETNDYYHFVTYGLSEIYEKETDNNKISGYGYEMTLKLKKNHNEQEIKGICSILQMIARITFTKGEVFHPYEYLYTGQKEGMDIRQRSNITGFITVLDNDLKSIDTINGKVDFIEFIGVTYEEIEALLSKQITVKELYQKLPDDITDYQRKSVI